MKILDKALRTGLPLALLALAALPAAAEVPLDMALSFHGEIYVARSGTCAELFEECATGNENHPLLAVDVLRAGQEPERLLVPGTENATPEGIPTVFFEDKSEVLYVVWEGKTASTQSLVNLAWRADEEWSTVEVSGDREPLKGPPRVAITRESFEMPVEEGGSPSQHQRSIVHISWSEEAGELVDFYYTPIVIEDSEYLGANQVYNLSALDPNDPTDAPEGISPALLLAPHLSRGRDANSVVVAFPSAASERFLSFTAHVVPAEVSLLASEAAAMLPANAGLLTPEGLAELADRIRTHIVDVGQKLHPAMVSFLADGIFDLVLSTESPAPEGAADLADRIRTHIVDVGARMAGSDGLSMAPPSEVDLMLAASPLASDGSPLGLLDHVVWLRLVADRPVPKVGRGSVWTFVSDDGKKGLVSWQAQGALRYRETFGKGWTGVRKIELDGPIDAETAERILRLRVEGF